MNIKKYVCAGFFLLGGFSALAGSLPSVAMLDGHAYISTPGGKRQVIPLKNREAGPDVKFIDLTFNGSLDLLILRDRGANQEFYDVYRYSEGKDAYIYDKRLSDIPCLGVDIKRRGLVGRCFHGSACENWEEYYSVSKNGNISLVERKGTYCDPVGGQGYVYVDRFRNGKKISSKTSPVAGQSDN